MSNYFDTYDPSAYMAQKQQAAPTPTTKKGFNATSLIPAAAAALSFIPGIGSVAAGALGAGGEALREKLNGENFDLAKIGTEGAISAVPFAAGRIAKLGVGAIKAAHGISAAEGLAKGASAVADTAKAAKAAISSERGAALTDIVRPATKASTAATNAGAKATATVPTFMSKISAKGADLAGEARGITAGKKVAGQDQLGVQGANELNQFLNTAGVKGGSAKQQLADLEAKHKVWGQQIGDTVAKNNRPLGASDLTNIRSRINTRVNDLVGLPKAEAGVALVGADGRAIIQGPSAVNHPYLSSLTQDLGKVHDLESANKFRQQLDRDAINYGRNSNAPDPVKEQIAKAFRGGLDEYVGEAIPQLKGVQNLYAKSADAQDFLKNAAKAPGGLNLPFIGKVGGEAIQGAKARVGEAAMAAGSDAATGGSTLFGKIKKGTSGTLAAGKAFGAQEAARLGVAATGVVPVPTIDNMTKDVPNNDAIPDVASSTLSGGTDTGGAIASGIDYNAEADKILNSGLDAKTQSAQLDLLAKRQAIEKAAGGGTGSKPLSVPANELIGNTNSGLATINLLRSELTKDPNLPLKNVIGGVAGNAGKGVLGTQPFDAAVTELSDVLARMRSGAALSAADEARYKRDLPTAFDSPAQIQAKLDRYQTLFEGLAARAQGGSPSLETVAGG